MTPEHPTDDTWERLATGELAPDERERVMAHVMTCATCTRAWRVVRQIARAARDFDPGVPATAPNDASDRHVVGLRRTRRALVIAGGAALAAAAALILGLRFGAPREAIDVDHAGVRGDRALAIELGALSPSELAWSAIPGAAHYRVEIFTFDGKPVLSRDTSTTTFTFAPPLPAGEYRVQVEAWAGGSRIAVSPPGRFTVP